MVNATLIEMSLQTPEGQASLLENLTAGDMFELAQNPRTRELYRAVEKLRAEDHVRRGISMLKVVNQVPCRIREDGAKIIGGRDDLAGLSPEQVREKLMAERKERSARGLR